MFTLSRIGESRLIRPRLHCRFILKHIFFPDVWPRCCFCASWQANRENTWKFWWGSKSLTCEQATEDARCTDSSFSTGTNVNSVIQTCVDCRCDRTSHCHLHLLCRCTVCYHRPPFKGTPCFLPLGGRLLTCQHPAGYRSTRGEREGGTSTKRKMTWHRATRNASTVQHKLARNDGTQTMQNSQRETHAITWKNTEAAQE